MREWYPSHQVASSVLRPTLGRTAPAQAFDSLSPRSGADCYGDSPSTAGCGPVIARLLRLRCPRHSPKAVVGLHNGRRCIFSCRQFRNTKLGPTNDFATPLLAASPDHNCSSTAGKLSVRLGLDGAVWRRPSKLCRRSDWWLGCIAHMGLSSPDTPIRQVRYPDCNRRSSLVCLRFNESNCSSLQQTSTWA